MDDDIFSDAVDLTEVFDHDDDKDKDRHIDHDNTVASSSLIEFGDDKLLWREDFAERATPVGASQRGGSRPRQVKKRKISNDYNMKDEDVSLFDDDNEEDDEFMDINDLVKGDRNATPKPKATSRSLSVRLPPTVSLQRGRSPKRKEALFEKRTAIEDQQDEREDEPSFLSSPDVDNSRKRKSSESPKGLRTPRPQTKQTEDIPGTTTATKKPRRSEVMDSEDEAFTPLSAGSPPRSADSFKSGGTTTREMGLDEDTIMDTPSRPPVESTLPTLESVESRPPPPTMDLPSRKPLEPLNTPRNQLLESVERPSQQPSVGPSVGPSFTAASTIAQSFNQSSTLAESSLPPSMQPPSEDPFNSRENSNFEEFDYQLHRPLLDLFVKHPTILERELSAVNNELQENMAKMRDCLRLPRAERDQAREEVKKEKEVLKRRDIALKALQDEHEAYLKKTKERDAIEDEIGRAYAEENDEYEEQLLLQLDKLGDEAEAIAKSLTWNIVTAGITENSFFDLKKEEEEQKPIIIATPTPSRTTEPPVLPSTEYHNSEQVILQTQHPSMQQQAAQRMPPPPTPSFQTARQTPLSYQSRPTHNSFPDISVEEAMMFDEEDPFMEMEQQHPPPSAPFQATLPQRTSPYKPAPQHKSVHGHDYFDDEEDDADLLAAVNSVETYTSTAATTGNNQSRSRSVMSTSTSATTIKPRKRNEKANAKKAKSRQAELSMPPEKMKFPWSPDVRKALKDRFRMAGFRQNQLEAINATLGGRVSSFFNCPRTRKGSKGVAD